MTGYSFRRIASLLLSALLIFSMLPPMTAMAATTLDSAKMPSGLSASYEGDTSNSKSITWTPSVSDNVGAISGTAVAGKKCAGTSYTYYACDTTLTITNTSGSDKLLEFSYDVTVSSAACQVTIAGTTYKENKTALFYSATLANNGSITINLKTEASDSSTATVAITNLKLVSADQEITATFDAATGGSYTVDGSTITQKTEKTAVATTAYALVATPASGYTFCGWMNTVDNSLLGAAKTLTITPKDGMVIKPIFASSSEAWFLAGGKTLYNNLNTAATYASTATEKTVVLMNSATLDAGDYTIPASVTLVIPFDEARTVVTDSPAVVTSYSTSTAPSVFRTLTMASGAKLILNGTLSVGGTLVASQTYGYNGLPTGSLGYIKMESGSSIQANSGSFIYVIGYIYGNGTVTVNSGATVYECFQIRDFRGGNATGSMRSSQKTFPLSQYYVQNIEVPMTINSGAIVKAMSAFNISGGFQIPVVPFIGNNSSYLFQITDGSIVKDYVEDTDRLHVQINGSLTVSPFTFEIPGYGGLASIDTNNFILPINQNITVEVASEKTLTISQSVALLPGAEIIINENATCAITSSKKVIVFDSENWGDYCGEKHHSTGGNVPVKPLLFVAGGAPKINRFTTTASSLADASLLINGTLDATGGSLYVTAGGANIYSTAEGELKLGDAPSNLTTYQATQSGSSISYADIIVYAAKLKQENGEYLNTAGTSATVYNYNHYECECETAQHGEWFAGEHIVTDTVVPNDCLNDGYTTHTCSCGHTYNDTETKATGHAWDNNCDTVCNNDETHTRDATHSYKTITIDATCAEDGSTTYTCSTCGDSYSETISALGHTTVTDAAVAPSCTATGLTEGKHCSVCGEVLVAQKEVAALGHDYAAVVTAPTCTEQGYTTHTCACGDSYVDSYVDATGHTWDIGTVTTPATCSTTGVKTFNCTVDGCNGIKTETVDKNPDNHKLVTDAAVAATCTTPGLTEGKHCEDCGAVTVTQTEVPALGHTEVVDAASAPTCTETGLTQGSHCSVCSEVLVAQKVVAALGHAYGDGVITTAPTCTATGVRTFTCGTCSGSYTETVAATGHSAVEVPAVAATCEATGLTAGTKCQTCGTTITAQQTVAALGHNFVNYTSNNDATCVSDGTKTATCTRCDATDTVADVDSKLGHDFQNYTSDNNATCAADGTKTAKCEREGCETTDTIDDEGSQTVVHTWGAYESNNDATCAKNGTETATCLVCETATTTREVENSKLDHTYSSVVTAPTCTASGYTTNTCSECGDTYTSDEVAALGHTEVAQEAVAATCTESGLTAGAYCSVCSEILVEQEVVPALGHSYSSAVTAPTCTEAGYTTYTCKNCGDSYVGDEVDAAGHTYNAVVTAPTCTKAGYTTYTCTVCGDSYVGDEVDAAGHTYNAVVTAPTCTEDGYTTYTCACGDSYVADKVPATGHSYGEWVQTTAPTCTKEGEKTRTCNCGEKETETVSALGHTNGAPVAENNVDATCGNAGSYDTVVYCVVCKVEVSRVTTTVAALGHNYNDGVVTTEPTCIAEGVKTFTCGTCGDTYTETIAAQGHDEVSHEAKAPTCIEPGWDAYVTCSRCDYTTYEEKAATGEHSDSAEDTDHICDTEGCEEVMNDCSDAEDDGDHKCDTCGKDAVSDHTEAEAVREDVVNATCGSAGSYDLVVYCSECGAELSREKITENATGNHRYSSSVTKEATCVEAGVRTYTCSGCGSSYTEEIPVTDNHDWKAATYTAPKTCSVCKLTEGEPLVDVENPENIPAEDIEEALDAMVKVTDAIQPEDSGMEADTNKGQLEEKTTAAGGISYNTSLVITLNAVVVDKDGEAMIAKKITYDVIPMLHILNEAGIQIDEQKITSFESEITFRLPVDKNTTAGFARVWHAETENLGLHKIQTDADGNKFVEVKSKKFSEFTLELEEECTEHTYGEDGKCTICGAEKPVAEEKPNTTYYMWRTAQIGLIEPWFLRVNNQFMKTSNIADGIIDRSSEVTEFGFYFLKASDMDENLKSLEKMTAADLKSDSDHYVYSSTDGKAFYDADTLTYYARFNDEIYTYELNDTIYFSFYYVDSNGRFATGVSSYNILNLVDGMLENQNVPLLEQNVYQRMRNLYENITTYRNTFPAEERVALETIKAPTLQDSQLAAMDVNNLVPNIYSFNYSAQILLIEPWGLRLNASNIYAPSTGVQVNLADIQDYGMVILKDKTGSTQSITKESLLSNPNAYVCSATNGTIETNANAYYVRFNKEIYTYELNTTMYYTYFVKINDVYYFKSVGHYNLLDLVNQMYKDMQPTTERTQYEKNVYGAMIELNSAITAYREDYFAKHPEERPE